MPISVSIPQASLREIRGFAHDMRRYGDIEGVAMGRASRDSLNKVKTQMIRNVANDVNFPVKPVRERFGKRTFLSKIRGQRSEWVANMSLGTRYTLPAGRGKNVRFRRGKGVLLAGYQFPNAFLRPSDDSRKKVGYVARRVGSEPYPIEEVGIDFIDNAETAWERNRGIADDTFDSRYNYWRERLYTQFASKKRGSASRFVRSIVGATR